MDTCTFNILSLCSGVEGLGLGLSLCIQNARTVCYVEREAYCCEVLVRRMEEGCLDEAPVWSDIGTFDGRPWHGIVDCITAGYPCQPFSQAGKRLGQDDDRYLWPKVTRVVKEVGPEWVFLENVSRHLSDGFLQVRNDLRRMGYRVAAGLFSADEMGAPHKRVRLFALAHSQREGSPRFGAERRLGECGTEVEVGRSDWWGSEPDVPRVDDGTTDWMDRVIAVGNSVVPAVAAYAWTTLRDSLEHPTATGLTID